MGVIIEVRRSAKIKSLKTTHEIGLIIVFPKLLASDHRALEYRIGKGIIHSTKKKRRQHRDKVA